MKMRLFWVLLMLMSTAAMAQDAKPQINKRGETELKSPKGVQSLDVKLKEVKVNDFINMPVPEDWLLMSDDQLAARYPSGRKPLAMYTSPDLTVNFGVNGTNNAWEDNDLKILADFQKANIRSLYDNVVFTRETIEKYGKKQFAVFEFIADNAAGKLNAKQRQYYHIMYCIVRKQVFIFNFNCPDRDKVLWQPWSAKMMKGVKVNK